MGDAIVRLYQKQNFVVGEDILKAIYKNNLTLDEALLIIYFCGNNAHPLLDIEDINKKFGMDELKIMQAFASLTNKNLINITMSKNKDDKIEEVIDLTPIYQSIAYELDEEKKKETTNNIFTTFEKEFGRPLSSMEFELINNWLDKGINEELIGEALKEAIWNGSMTLRYIDAILMEWTKKGFKTSEDVNAYLKKKKSKPKPKSEELFDYNWLEDDDE